MKSKMKYLFTALSLLAFGLTSCNDGPSQEGYDNSAVKSVELDSNYQQMQIGDSIQLTPTVTYRDGEVEVYKEWRSSKYTVATVDETGFVTAVGSGKAYITYRAGLKMAYCTIYVPSQGGSGGGSGGGSEGGDTPEPVDPSAFRIGLDATTRTLGVGSEFVLTATPTEVVSVTWTVIDSNLEDSSANGEVISYLIDASNPNAVNIKGLQAGTAKMQASANGVTASCLITVVESGGGGGEPLDGQDYEIFMYIDYNNVDESDKTGTKLLAHFFWYSDSPVGESGKVPNVTNDMALDRAFPYFQGWSLHSIIDTKADLVDLNTYEVGTASYVINFYGIWSDVPSMSI